MTKQIITPTARELKMPFRIGVCFNGLDTEIESAVLRDTFFVSAYGLKLESIKRKGYKNLCREDRRRVFEVCLNAVLDMSAAIDEGEMKSRGTS